jgi:hypothetical protein
MLQRSRFLLIFCSLALKVGPYGKFKVTAGVSALCPQENKKSKEKKLSLSLEEVFLEVAHIISALFPWPEVGQMAVSSS